MKVPEPRKLKCGTWFLQLRLGGESIPISAATASECKNQAALIKAEYLNGKAAAKKRALGGLTLRQACGNYIERRSNTLSPVTIRTYKLYQNYRFQRAADLPISKIDWQREVNAEAALCAPKTLKNAWGFIRSVIYEATGQYPPAVKLPGAVPAEKAFLDPAQIKVFVKEISKTQYAVPALLALSSLRVSEISALDWTDIKKDFVHVRGAAVYNAENKMVKKPQNKNATSNRKVPILIPELEEAIKKQRKASGPVLTIRQNNLREGINRVCERNGLPRVGIHGLRHSFASLAYHLQMPEKIAMEIGGWADMSTMHKIYTHIAQSDIERYKTKLADFYNAN